MSALVVPPYRKRFILAMLVAAILASLFWTGSRYPQLTEMAMMPGQIQPEDSLSFKAMFPITDDMGLAERIFWSTLNWVNTNKKGMTFGILFAAAFLTAAAYVRQRSFKGSFANSALGLAIGTPLGVCANCAAPIARGMYSAGLRAETTLSAMVASPTLNIVVLTMLFSLLPVYMALIKIGLSLLLILVLVPLICRALPVREIEPQVPGQTLWSDAELAAGTREGPDESVFAAMRAVAAGYLKNLWYIVKLTVPLMLLAGFLGTAAATLLPQELILGLPFSAWALVLIALVGVFLPVPIAFDVVAAGALLGLGLAHGYVMALLFTLGSFSIYSFLIVAQSVGQRAAWLMGATIAVLGVLGGGAAEYYHRWQAGRTLETMLQESRPAPPSKRSVAHFGGAGTVTNGPPAAGRNPRLGQDRAPGPNRSRQDDGRRQTAVAHRL